MIVLYNPVNHADCTHIILDDIVIAIYLGLAQVGLDVVIRYEPLHPSEYASIHQSIWILFGAHVSTRYPFPLLEGITLPGSITPIWGIYNLEQRFSPHFSELYLARLRSASFVCDYAELNRVDDLQRWYHLPLGFAPNLTRGVLAPASDEKRSTDVLFFGWINTRRNVVLQGLQHAGLQVERVATVFGTELIRKIHSAKIILNIHFYIPAVLEQARLATILSNGGFVISEESQDDTLWRSYVEMVPYNKLISSCIEWLHPTRESERKRVARQRFNLFRESRPIHKSIPTSFIEMIKASGSSHSGPIIDQTD